MADFQTVARVEEIPEGEAKAFAINGRIVAVFHDGGKLYAIDDTCPHMGASLAQGTVMEGAVTCCWHAWRFNLADGTWMDNPRLKVDTFEVRVQDGEIQVAVPT